MVTPLYCILYVHTFPPNLLYRYDMVWYGMFNKILFYIKNTNRQAIVELLIKYKLRVN